MSSLSSFSLETDKIVLLTFADGSSLRVTHDQLDGLVAAEELKNIQQSIEKRANFIKSSLPIWARTIVMSLGVGLLGLGTVQAGHRIWQRFNPAPPAAEAPAAASPAVISQPAKTQPAAVQSEPSSTATQRAQQVAPVALPQPLLPEQARADEVSPVFNSQILPALPVREVPVRLPK